VAINDQPVDPERYVDQRAQWLARCEFHLTWMVELQTDSRIVAGRWWSPEDIAIHQFSVETGIAESLGTRLGRLAVGDCKQNPSARKHPVVLTFLLPMT
jgi:putative ABC transport system permease protein